MRFNPRNDLLWLAARYVSREMGPDELDAFEARLEGDQAAREAVAEAVELALAIAAAAPDLSTPLTSGRVSRPPLASLAALAAAACLAMLASLAWLPRHQRPPAGSVVTAADGPSDARTRGVVLTWSGLQQPAASEASGAGLALNQAGDEAEADDTGGEPTGTLAVAGVESPADLDALPVWLLEAASLRDLDAAGNRGLQEN